MKYLLLLLLCTLLSCSAPKKEIIVKNTLAAERFSQTVSIAASDLGPLISPGQNIVVKDRQSRKEQLTQWLDLDGDSVTETLIFQVDVGAMEEKRFTVEPGLSESAGSAKKTYSRFVPERTDDYAWENDVVAFRTYGPKAQQLVEDGKPGGTLSSGIDCWLKRVDYPIIDKWYKKNTEGGSYHQDSGEGLDNYHVGASRGCGGLGVLLDDSLYVSLNFTAYKILANGPIRTVFELTYAPWSAGNTAVREKKRITIDLGSQLSRIDVLLKSDSLLPNCTAGITLHDKKGKTSADTVEGWFSYWEPLDDSELGTGIVVSPEKLLTYKDYRTMKKDLSQLHVVMKPGDAITYYAGFGWKKAGRFNTAEEWNNYLADFATQLDSPLEVNVVE